MTRGFLIGAAIATGVVMLVPGVARALSQAGRPLTRAGLKTGAYAYKEFQKAGAEVYEHFEDLAAEVEAELREEAEEATAEGGEAADAEWTAEVRDIKVKGPEGRGKGHG